MAIMTGLERLLHSSAVRNLSAYCCAKTWGTKSQNSDSSRLPEGGKAQEREFEYVGGAGEVWQVGVRELGVPELLGGGYMRALI